MYILGALIIKYLMIFKIILLNEFNEECNL